MLEMQDVVDSGNGQVQETEARFGERVRDFRIRKGLSQKVLADRLGLDASAVSRLEQGSRAIRLGEAALIAEVLDARLDELIVPMTQSDPHDTFDQYKQAAEERIHDLRKAAAGLAIYYVGIVHLLDEHPEILPELTFGGWRRHPKDAKDFLALEAKHLPKLYRPEGVLYTDAETIELIMDILQALARSAISPKPAKS